MKIRVSFTYEPRPDSYEHVAPAESLTAEMIAASDQAAYDDGEFSLEEIASEGSNVTFEAVTE